MKKPHSDIHEYIDTVASGSRLHCLLATYMRMCDKQIDARYKLITMSIIQVDYFVRRLKYSYIFLDYFIMLMKLSIPYCSQ